MTLDQLNSHATIIAHLTSIGWTCVRRTYGSFTSKDSEVFEAVYSWELTPPNAQSDLDSLDFDEPFTLEEVWKAYGENLADDAHGDAVAEAFGEASIAVLNQLSAIYARRAAGDTSVEIPREIMVPAMTISLTPTPKHLSQ